MNKTSDSDSTWDETDRILASARVESLPPALEARMLEDAVRLQPNLVPPPVPRATPRPPARPWLARLRDGLGGWAPMGGHVAAGLVGVWVGMAPPAISGDPIGRLIEARQGLDILDPDGFSDFTVEVQ